jgi:hypothetical protein
MSVISLGLGSLTVGGSLVVTGTTLTLVNDAVNPGANYYYGTDSGGVKGFFSLASEGVNSIAGTTNQIVASASTGAVTLSLATTLVSINSVTSAAGQNLVLALGTGGTALTLTSSTLAATFAGAIAAASTSAHTLGPITFTNGVVTALTSATAPAATDLTLAGGSSGASLVLGQGANGAVTITPKGTGYLTAVFGGTDSDAIGTVFSGRKNNAAGQVKVFDVRITPGTPAVLLTTSAAGADPHLDFSTAGAAAQMRLTVTNGNLLIGGTTDGGQRLQVFGRAQIKGTGATSATYGLDVTDSGGVDTFWVRDDGAAYHKGDVSVGGTTAAISTTSGSLINAGGFGNAGAAYIGGVCQIGTATNFATANAGVIQSFRTSADGQLRLTRSGAHDWDIFGGATTLYMTVDGGSSIFSLGTTGNATLAGNLTASSTTEATTTAAAIATEGGILAKKKLALSTYADGTLSVATGIVVSSSDARLKNITGSFTRGLADVVKIHPAKYTWRPESGVISAKEYSGFVAQDVQAAIPEAVSADAMGMRGLSDRTILAAVVNGMKELADRPSAVEIRIFELIALAALILGIRANISSIRK